MPEPTALEWLRDIAANGYIMSVSLRDGGHGDLMPKDITAGIEEAVAAERERIRAAVEGLRLAQDDYIVHAMNGTTRTPRTPADWVEAYRAAVLRIIDESKPASTKPASTDDADPTAIQPDRPERGAERDRA